MKVDGARAATRAAGAAPAAAKSTAGVDTFALPAVDDTAPPPAVGGAPAMVAIDALMSVQEISSDPDGRARGKTRGDRLLERLDVLRHGLLSGRLSVEELDALAALLETERAGIDDPGLAETLDEIELRVRVELAKFGRAG